MNSDLEIAVEFLSNKSGFSVRKLKLNEESINYGASSFLLNGKSVQFRVSKITPNKTGQFVAIWKRNKEGITEAYDFLDAIDFLIVAARFGENYGLFVFPKQVLVEYGVISQNGQKGKRGMRVYPPWDLAPNKQAIKTQSWQTKYFSTIQADQKTDSDLIVHLFS